MIDPRHDAGGDWTITIKQIRCFVFDARKGRKRRPLSGYAVEKRRPLYADFSELRFLYESLQTPPQPRVRIRKGRRIDNPVFDSRTSRYISNTSLHRIGRSQVIWNASPNALPLPINAAMPRATSQP